MKTKKPMTLSQLAAMVKRGFDGMDKRLDATDNRLDAMVTKKDFEEFRAESKMELGGVKYRLDRIEEKLTNVAWQSDMKDHERRIARLENIAGTLKK